MAGGAGTSTSTRLDFLPDVLEEHLEELQVLLVRRDDVLRSGDARLRHLVETDARILAHVDGVHSIGDRAFPYLRAALAGEDIAAVEVACFALSAAGTNEAAAIVIDAWERSEDLRLLSIASALMRSGSRAVLTHLAANAGTGSMLRQVAAARTVVRHGTWRPVPHDVQQYVRDPAPVVRRQGWLLVRDAAIVLDPKTYAAALRDDDGDVRDTALLAAAWTGVEGALHVARARAQTPSIDDPLPLRLLAVLGGRSDAPAITSLANHEPLGALRFELVGLYGSPVLVPLLLDAMSVGDPRSAIAAGQAFARITGVDVTSTERAYFPREGEDPNDEFAAEFQDEGLVPDVAKAHRVWTQLGSAMEGMHRAYGGSDVSNPLSWSGLQDLDLESRWWHLLRGRFWRVIDVSIADFERFPVR